MQHALHRSNLVPRGFVVVRVLTTRVIRRLLWFGLPEASAGFHRAE